MAPLQTPQLKDRPVWGSLVQVSKGGVIARHLLLPLVCGVSGGFGRGGGGGVLRAGGAAAQRRLGDEAVQRPERAHPGWQEVPGAQETWEEARPPGLQRVDEGDEDHDAGEGRRHAHHGPPSRHGQAEHQRGQQQEADHQVEHSEPAVMGRVLAQLFRHADGQARHGQGVPQQDPQNVEEEVAQGDLEWVGLNVTKTLFLK